MNTKENVPSGLGEGREVELRMATPFIDPNVQYVRISKLRTLNIETLRNLKKTLVIQDGETPLAVILPYEVYLAMQGECQLAAIRRGDFIEAPQE